MSTLGLSPRMKLCWVVVLCLTGFTKGDVFTQLMMRMITGVPGDASSSGSVVTGQDLQEE